MSFERLNQKIADIRATAGAVQAAHANSIRDLNADNRISNSERRNQADQVRADTQAKLDALKDQEDTAIATERRDLQRRINGATTDDPAAVISFRDAQDRAAALDDSQETAALMRRALDSGDSVLANAVLGRAVELGHDDTIDAYTAEHPDAADAVRDLSRIARRDDDLNSDFETYATYKVPNTPLQARYEGNTLTQTGWA